MKQKPRTSVIRIRVLPEERSAIDAAALLVGLGPCSFARMATVKAAGRKPMPAGRRKADLHAVALAKWTGELGRVGSLLNQLCKAHHVGFDIDPVDVTQVRDELAALRMAVLAFNADESQS